MELLARLFSRHRGALAVLVVGLTILSVYGITRLRFDDDPRNVFKTHEADFRQLEEQFDEFGSDDSDCIFVIEGDTFFTPAAMTDLRRLVAQIGEVDGVERVVSLFDARRNTGLGRLSSPIALIPPNDSTQERFDISREQAIAHPLVGGQLLSADARTMLVVAKLENRSLKLTGLETTVVRLREIAHEFNGHGGLQVRLTGVPPIRFEITRNIERDLVKFNVAGAVLAMLIAYLVFRQVSAVIIVIAAPALGSVWVLGALGLAGVSINVLNAVVPTLVLVVGLTDSVHFLLDIKRSRAAHVGELDASMSSIMHVGVACGLTSITSAIGFASLVVARADIIRGFGLACSAGSICAFLAVMLIVPLLASTRLGSYLGEHRESEPMASGWATWLINFATTHPLPITVFGIATTVVLGFVSLRLSPDSWLTENLPAHSDAAAALAKADQEFGGVMFVYTLVEWPESMTLASQEVHDALVEVHALIDKQPEMSNPMSVLKVAESLPVSRNNWPQAVRYMERGETSLRGMLRQDKRHMLVSAHVRDTGAASAGPASKKFAAGLAEIESRYPDLKLRLTGTTVVASTNITGMIGDLGSSLGLESLVIFGLMTWSFRSWGLGLISIIPNVFPLVCVASLMVFLGMPLQFGSVIVFNICLGLAVDDTIHVMTKFNEEMAKGGSVRAAIRRSFSLVGTAVLTTTFILLAGFGVVTLSDIPALRLFGGLSCVTILAALLGELIFTPALLLTFLSRRYATQVAQEFAGKLVTTSREQEILAGDLPGHPQTMFARVHVSGVLKRPALRAALAETLLRHPLLGSHLSGQEDLRHWVPAESSTAPLLFIGAPADGGLPTAGFIDLQTEVGLRAWVLEGGDQSSLVLQFHQAGCDRAAAFQFIGDLLSAYAAQVEDCTHVDTHVPLDATLLATRDSQTAKPGSWWSRVQFARTQSRRVMVLAEATRESDVADDYPAVRTHIVSAADLVTFDSLARLQGVRRIDLFARDLLQALDQWCASYRPEDTSGWLRLMLPTDRAMDTPAAMPAAHLEKLTHLDQRAGDTNRVGLLAALVAETQANGLRPALAAQSGATCVLSVMGPVLSGVALPRERDRIVAGNVVLEGVELTFPTGPRLPVTISAVEYAGQLSICLHYDSRVLGTAAADDLLELFVRHLRHTIAQASAEQEAGEPASIRATN